MTIYSNPPRILIVGGGMSGIATASRLIAEGYQDVTIVEKAPTYGGTWRDNIYPGVACDVPSALYSYSFAPSGRWSSVFAPGAEIRNYLEGVADHYGLQQRTHFNTTAETAEWRDGHWSVSLSNGATVEADVLVAATGVLREPKLPAIKGLSDFQGEYFHSARWDQTVDISQSRVGLIGNGSTGVQIVNSVAGRAKHLSVFQRTPQWIMPVPNIKWPSSAKFVLQHMPVASQALRWLSKTVFDRFVGGATVNPGMRRALVSRLCRQHVGKVADPELRRALTPADEPMCRRLVVADGYYDSLQRNDVDLVTTMIDRVEATGVRTTDGVLHELDVLVLATGFDAHRFIRPMHLKGLNGKTIDDEWADGAKAYKTVALPDFPNFFMLLGPYSPFGNQSQMSVAETQIGYILQWLHERQRGGWTAAAPTRAATDEFNATVRATLTDSNTVWTSGCSNAWYQGADGLPELWPWRASRHQRMLERPDLDEWTVIA